MDVIGFLALGGLFTAHITGNLVVLAAHYITGNFSQIGPLLSVPVFIAVLGTATVAFGRTDDTGRSRRALLVMHAAFRRASSCLAQGLAPLANPDSALAVLTGMLGVAAMATQNALVRLAFPGSPSAAVLTTNTTQLVIDLATLAGRRGETDEVARARRRAGLTLPSVAGFVFGCAAGAFLEVHLNLLALALPAILAALAVPLGERWSGALQHCQRPNPTVRAGLSRLKSS